MTASFDEAQYRPCQTSSLPAGVWLVIAPHADDETFGMGGAIALASAMGTPVDVLIMTDGAQGGGAPDIVAIREKEAQRATQALGCRSVHFMRQADRGLHVSESNIARVVEQIRTGKYAAVFFPSPLEAHPDHRASTQIAWEALRRLAFCAQPFSYEISAQGPCNLLVDISSVTGKKAEIMRIYGSQLAHNAYVERILGLNAARAWSLPLEVTHAEAFYRWAPSDQPLSAQLWGIQYAQQSSLALPEIEAHVSIIMRTMNRPEMLREAIRSVACQTHSSIELILVNDGEEDFSSLLAQEAVGSITSFQCLKNEGVHGRAQAANLGLRHAKGDFIAFLDDDDWLLPDHLRLLLAKLKEHPSAIAAYGGVDSVRFEDGQEQFMHRFNDPFDPLRLAYNNFMPIHSVVFKRSVIEHGCMFDERLDLYEDWHFWLQLARLGSFVHLDEITAKYRIAHESGVGLPTTTRDTTLDMNRFVEASRNTWSTEQLRHMCMSTILVSHLRSEVEGLKGQISGLNADINQLRQAIAGHEQHLDAKSVHIRNLEAISKQQQDEFTAQSKQLQSEIQAQARQAKLWQARFEEVTGSRSWRLTQPLRTAGRKTRRVRDVLRTALQRSQGLSARELTGKIMSIWRSEGWRGLRDRLHPRAPTDVPTGITQEPVAFAPLDLIRQDDGRYALHAGAAGYQYIPPSPPLDMQAWLDALASPPRFSIVVPVYNTPPGLLGALVDSILAQWYPHWELVLADDASPSESLQNELARFTDTRIVRLRLESNQGISGATNAGVAQASGDWIVFADHDDLLTADSLFELARCIERERPDFVYSDEDKLDEKGRFTQPHFKPDWSPDTMMSTMFTGHISCVRKALFEDLGGLRSEVNGCQDWDFVLRLAERTQNICHIPKVLYHWRIIPESVAADIAAKPYVLAASQRVREDAIVRRGQIGTVEAIPQVPGYFRVNYHPLGEPLISIIIPTRDHAQVLKRCIESIEQKSSYRRFEILVIDNGSKDAATLSLLDALHKAQRALVIRHDQPFNFSELNNVGVRVAKGELLLFLNDDTEILSADWLERMAGYAQLAHVGAVGAKLLYPNGRVQHAGVLNLAEGPIHAMLNTPADQPGYFMRNLLEYNWLAVTGACLMLERRKFLAVGGFDESFPVAYNDVDLCFRLHDAGQYNVVCQAVHVRHYESQSRGLDHLDAAKRQRLKDDMRRLYTVHPRYFQYDPFYNPNLHPNGINFELLCS